MATPLSSTIQRDGSGEQLSGAGAQPPKRCGGENPTARSISPIHGLRELAGFRALGVSPRSLEEELEGMLKHGKTQTQKTLIPGRD
jgi:hypothetical protein